MLGLALLLATYHPDLIAIQTIRSKDPVGVYFSGSTFKAVEPVHQVSEFLGTTPDGKLRFDLVPEAIRTSRLKDSKTIWQRRCDDAVLNGSKIYCLYNNDLITYRSNGRIQSRRKLTRSSIVWQYLDPNLRYALGFRSKPESKDTWPLFLLDIATLSVHQLPITYDLGGHVYPAVVSYGKTTLLYDLFYAYLYSGRSIRKFDVTMPALAESFYIVDAHASKTGFWVLLSERGSEVIHIVDVQSGRSLCSTIEPIRGFVNQVFDQRVYVWSTDGTYVRIFALSALNERRGDNHLR